jgi:hypothetical protein
VLHLLGQHFHPLRFFVLSPLMAEFSVEALLVQIYACEENKNGYPPIFYIAVSSQNKCIYLRMYRNRTHVHTWQATRLDILGGDWSIICVWVSSNPAFLFLLGYQGSEHSLVQEFLLDLV